MAPIIQSCSAYQAFAFSTDHTLDSKEFEFEQDQKCKIIIEEKINFIIICFHINSLYCKKVFAFEKENYDFL